MVKEIGKMDHRKSPTLQVWAQGPELLGPITEGGDGSPCTRDPKEKEM